MVQQFQHVLEKATAGVPGAAGPHRPVDIARTVHYLACNEAAFVPGTLLDVDGGIFVARPN